MLNLLTATPMHPHQTPLRIRVSRLMALALVPFLAVTHALSVPYVVRTGDTLTAIARRYDTSVELIAQANRIANVDHLLVGQRLVIPNPALSGQSTAAHLATVAQMSRQGTPNNGRTNPRRFSKHPVGADLRESVDGLLPSASQETGKTRISLGSDRDRINKWLVEQFRVRAASQKAGVEYLSESQLKQLIEGLEANPSGRDEPNGATTGRTWGLPGDPSYSRLLREHDFLGLPRPYQTDPTWGASAALGLDFPHSGLYAGAATRIYSDLYGGAGSWGSLGVRPFEPIGGLAREMSVAEPIFIEVARPIPILIP